MTVTPEAVTAARKAISCTCDGSLPHDVSCDKDISDAGLSAALEAAAPHIRAAERERIAAWLTRAAAGRREYAASAPDDENRARLELAAACCESAAKLITDPSHMLDVIPSWRFTDAEIADLIPGGDTGG